MTQGRFHLFHWSNFPLLVVVTGAFAAALVAALDSQFIAKPTVPYVVLSLLVLCTAVAHGIIPGLVSATFSVGASSFSYAILVRESLIAEGAIEYLLEGMFFFPMTALVGAYIKSVMEKKLQALTDEQLKKQSSHYESILKLSSDWFWEQDEEYKFIKFSPHGEAQINLQLKFSLGRRRWESPSAYPDDEYWKSHIEKIMRREPFRDFRYRMRGANGDDIWLSIDGVPRFDENKVFRGYSGTGRDITAILRFERMVEERKNRLGALLEHSPVAIVVRDEKFEVSHWNPAAEKLFGQKAANMIGEGIDSRLCPESFYHWKSGLKNAIGSGRSIIDENIEVARGDGSVIVASFSASPVYDDHGRFSGVISFFRDVTEQVRREAELKEATDRINSILDSSPIPIYARDMEGRIIYWNHAAERLMGWKPEEMIGNVIQFRPPETSHMNGLARGSVHKSLEFINLECVFMTKDGRHLEISQSVGPVKSKTSDGSTFLKGTVHFIQDITEQKKQERARNKAENELRAMLNCAPEGIIMRDLATGLGIECNPAITRILGWSREDLLTSGDPVAVNAEDENYIKAQAEVMAGRIHVYEAPCRRKDGSTIIAEISVAPVLNEAGIPSAKISMVRDITRQKLEQKSLMERESFLRAIIDNAGDAIVIRSVPGNNLLIWNKSAEKLFGWVFDERSKDKAIRVLHPDHMEMEIEKIRRVSRGEKVIYESRRLHKNGSAIEVQVSMAPVMDETGNVVARVSVVRDISEEKRQSERAKVFALAAEYTADAMIITDAKMRVSNVNRAFSVITEYKIEDIRHEKPWMLLSKSDDVRMFESMASRLKESGHFQSNAWMRRKSGELFLARFSFAAAYSESGEISHHVGLITDLSAMSVDNLGANVPSMFDYLTGLPARELLMDRIDVACARARKDGAGGAVIVLNIDNFTSINESAGMMMGDKLLIEVSKILRKVAGVNNTVARTGGDEFTILVHRCATWECAANIALSAEREFSREVQVGDERIFISASVGISQFPGDGDNAIDLFEAAQFAMIKAKQAGGNRQEFSDVNFNHGLFEIRALHEKIEGALERDEMKVYLHPIVDLNDGRVVGVEAMMFWETNGRATHPDRFMPVAERIGLIDILDWKTFHEACAHAKLCLDQGIASFFVAISPSSKALLDHEFCDRVREMLDKTGFPASLLTVQVSSQFIFEHHGIVVDLMRRIDRLGVGTMISRFSDNLISATILDRIPAGKVKIDQAQRSSRDYQKTVAAFVQIAKSYQFEIVGSGLGNSSALRQAMNLGIHYAQGEHIISPAPQEEVTKMIAGDHFRGHVESLKADLLSGTQKILLTPPPEREARRH